MAADDSKAAEGFIHVTCSSDPEQEMIRGAASDGTIEAELPAGSYQAVFESTDGRFGPMAGFEVLEETVEVWLEVPRPFGVRLLCADQRSGDGLEGARVSFLRTDLADAGIEVAERAVFSGPGGTVVAEDLAQVTWTITGSLAEYSTVTSQVELPGRWSEQLEESGELTIGTFKLIPLTRVTFELVDIPTGTDPAQFRIAHTHQGDPVAFDGAGRAVVELGRFEVPLYVKLWHPDGRESIRYLDGGLPGDGDVHEISVGGGQELEVDLRLGREVRDALPLGGAAVQVSFRDENGDAVLVVEETNDSGVFRFDGLDAKTATVSLTVVEDGWPVAWRAETLALAADRRNTCTLSVMERPLKLACVDGDGAPVPGFHAEVRHVPDTTTWIAGGACGEDGMVTVPRATSGRYSMSGSNEDYSVVAVDLPVDLSAAGSVVTVSLSPITQTLVECQVDGKPRAGVRLSMIGADLSTSFGDESTDDEGRTEPYGLVDRSRARARLESLELWAPAREIDLLPGRNVLVAFETGVVEGRLEQLASLRSLAFGISLQDWRDAGQIRIEASGGRRFRTRVPAGEYLLDTVAGEEVALHVLVGETAALP
ncbi:hypothetical protein [Planctomycetes bacterium Poly30]|uniref:hypothetical protein n=1 Tax=Saltatorellus ferox TaxID=2528018 RepID=UPI0011A4240D